jgi:hypothetical protein
MARLNLGSGAPHIIDEKAAPLAHGDRGVQAPHVAPR